MGHLPQSGPGGMIEWLKPAAAARKILIHINNTNPILRRRLAGARELDARGHRGRVRRHGDRSVKNEMGPTRYPGLEPRRTSKQQLRAKGERYHIHHPFNVALNSGRCTRSRSSGWVANRFYYQISIPIKDAAILVQLPDREQRRGWVQRILDHDGERQGATRAASRPGCASARPWA